MASLLVPKSRQDTGSASGAAWRPSVTSVYGRNIQEARSTHSIRGTGGRPSDMIHNHKAYDLGVIFSTAVHSVSQNDDPDGADQSVTRLGIVNSKFRKFVVVARFGEHVIAVPIYTHGGRGSAHRDNHDEYVPIQDSETEKKSSAQSDSPFKTLRALYYPEFRTAHSLSWHRMTDKTEVHFTELYSHKTDRKATISGKLQDGSKTYLQDLVAKIVLAAMEENSAKAFRDINEVREIAGGVFKDAIPVRLRNIEGAWRSSSTVGR